MTRTGNAEPGLVVSSMPVLSIAEPEQQGLTLRVSVQANKLSYQLGGLPNSSLAEIQSRLRMFKRGSIVTITDAAGSAISWTAETFGGNDAKLGNLLQKLDPGACEIQFSQRCILSKSGFASWLLRITPPISAGDPAELRYDLKTTDSFESTDTKVRPAQGIKLANFAKGGQLIALRNNKDDTNHDAQSFHFFSVSGSSASVDIVVDPHSNDNHYDLRYETSGWNPDSKTEVMDFGNGVELAPKNVKIWQSCVYQSDGPKLRHIAAGIRNISTQAILEIWNENVAHRYYDSLVTDQLFSALPELTCVEVTQPTWSVEFHLRDKYPLRIDKAVWFSVDSDSEATDPTESTGSEPADCIASRVRSVRLIPLDPNQRSLEGAFVSKITATLRMFRTQNGGPVILNGLTLKSLQNPQGRYGWWFVLSASGTTDGDQVVRAGGFELHIPGTVSQGDSFSLNCRADYGFTGESPSLFPRVPQIELEWNVPLRDVVPAGEDDLNVDLYAQSNAEIPIAGAGPNQGDTSREYEIQRNLQREGALIFRNPAKPNPTTQDGSWHLRYSEKAIRGTRQSIKMSLIFAALNPQQLAKNPKGDESVVVLDRLPFTFAEVHFHPLKDAEAATGIVAEWDSMRGAWSYIQTAGHSDTADTPSYLVLPPQLIAEEVVTEDANDNYPQGLKDGKQPRMLLGTPTIVTYKPDSKRNFTHLPWDLRRLLTDNSLPVSRIDYEMLYGLACNTNAPVMRLTEAATLYGNILDGLRPAPFGYMAGAAVDPQYLNARLHWSRIFREYQSRLGLFVVEGVPNVSDPEGFRDTANTACELRLNDQDPETDDTAISPYMSRSSVSADYDKPDFKGGALVGVNNRDIYKAIVQNRKSDRTHAAVIDPRFSVVGGFGTTQARFDQDRSTLINTIAMGRTVTYSVERIGRIACHWNRAKHVIVYQRTVVPSRQFYSAQKLKSKFPGIPLVRKVEEYVEILQKERIFAAEPNQPQAAFMKGFKCGERTRIPVDSAWGSTVPGKGWKVPLWNSAAGTELPDVYPKPQFYLEVSTPEQTLDSTAANPKFVVQDCLLERPQELFFFTSTASGLASPSDTDTWPAVETVDCVGYPMLVPDPTIYETGDLNATPMPECAVPPGWEPVTFTVQSPPTGIHATDGIVSTQTPIAAKLRTLTVSRGSSPIPTTIKKVLGATNYAAYAPVSVSLGGLPQAFGAIRNAFDNPITTQRVTEIQNGLDALRSHCKGLQSQIPALLPNVSSAVQQSFVLAGQQLAKNIDAAASDVFVKVNSLLGGVSKVLANPAGLDPHDPWIVEAGRIIELIRAGQSEVQSWNTNWSQTQIHDHLNAVIQSWSAELEQAVGSFSPLRAVGSAIDDFRQSVDSIEGKLNTLTALKAPPTAQALLQSCQALVEEYDHAATGLASGFASIQSTLQQFDLSAVMLGVNSSSISGQFQAAVESAIQAAANSDAAQAQAQINATLKALSSLRTTTFAAATKYVNSAAVVLSQAKFDLLRQSSIVQKLYGITSVQALGNAINQIAPDALLTEIQTKKQNLVDSIRLNSTDALNSISAAVGSWITSQIPTAGAPWNNLFAALNGLNVTASTDLLKLKNTLDGLATGIQGAIDSTTQTVDQYVRQPLMQKYQRLASEADPVMRVVRAFGDPPQAPHLDLQPSEVAYVYDYVNNKIPITPVLARANQVGQALNALGVNLPATQLAEGLVPADLKQFDLNKVLPNFSGLNLGGLFSGVKLPEIANQNIIVTHGWDPQARRAWLESDVNVPISTRMVVFQAGFFAFSLSDATFRAHSKIENNGAQIQQTTSGSIKGKWSMELSESNSLISFVDTALIFDETGKLQFKFNPANVKLADALQSISSLVQSFSDPQSGFTYGTVPGGVKCKFALPVPDTSGLTSGMTGLSFSTSLELSYKSSFDITLTVGVSSKDRPFNFAIFILGGCGYLSASVTYHIDTKTFDPLALDLAIGCSASLAIALGPISGGVYAQFAIELQNSGNGFRAGAFFQITGHVSLLGMVSIDIVLRLEATYADGIMTATGHISYEIKLFMFSISVSTDVSMRLGSGGQGSRLVSPIPPQNKIAALAGPDGFVPGLAAAFAAAEKTGPARPSFAQRYVNMLI
jgi:hypothetical protein